MTRSDLSRLPFYFSIVVTVVLRSLVRVACALGFVLTVARGQASASASGTSATPAASVAALLASLPSWSASTSLYSGFGYDDNVVLSHADEERSAFALGGFDALLLHTPRRWMDDYSF